MKATAITKMAILGVLAVLVIYDIIVYAAAGVDATISRVALRWFSNLPIVAVAIGVVIGHLCWPQRVPFDRADTDRGEE